MTPPMDRTELIARLLCKQDGYDPDGGPKVGYGWINYRERAQEVIAALESRPAPTEERILVAAKAACRTSSGRRSGPTNPLALEAPMSDVKVTPTEADIRAAKDLASRAGCRFAADHVDMMIDASAETIAVARLQGWSECKEAAAKELDARAERARVAAIGNGMDPNDASLIDYEMSNAAALVRNLTPSTPESAG